MHLRLFDVRFDDPVYQEFLVGQEKAYAQRGHAPMARFGRDDPDTTADPIRCVAVFDDGVLVGGLRVHLRVAGRLPSEIHLKSAEVSRLVADACAAGESVAEVCGLWVDHEWPGRRPQLAQLVTVTGVVAAERHGATVITGSCAGERRAALERCGFRWQPELVLPGVPFPGVTSYFTIDGLAHFYDRNPGLTAAMTSLSDGLSGSDLLPAATLRTAAEHLGLRLFAPTPRTRKGLHEGGTHEPGIADRFSQLR
ncbi:N-acyl amino acid synthase FeeM domain-containing protein [Streptomyces violascens]|uniref:N-acyl amino acid synthase FeeM domain-containing protein n=1 Tax=Streptomyces violascens TaxID=67381 RepID=UPI0037BC32DE